MTRGQGDDWAQAAALGLSIDPANPLYAGAATAATAATVAAVAASAPAAPAGRGLSAEELAQQVMLSNQVSDPFAAPARPDLDLDLSSDATAVPAVPVAAPVAAAAPAEDHTLDFDLGGLSFDPEPAPVAKAEPAMDFSIPLRPSAPSVDEPAPAKAKDDEYDMSFDMEFNTVAAPTSYAPAAEPKTMDDLGLELNAHQEPEDFGTVDLSKEFGAQSSAANAELDSMDFDLDPPAQPAAAPAGTVVSHDFSMPDLPDLSPSKPVPQAAPQFDMSSIDLDLPVNDRREAAETALPEFEPADVAVEAAELSPVHMEMETKLDLALAYQEIGDKEGARELLDEVIKGGSAEQVSKANDMRVKLA